MRRIRWVNSVDSSISVSINESHMGIVDLFSKRRRKSRGELPDVLSYDQIPNVLRVQIVHLWKDAIGRSDECRDRFSDVEGKYKLIVDTLCREYGLFELPTPGFYNPPDYLTMLANWFLSERDTERVLDAIEISFRVVDRVTRSYDYRKLRRANQIADETIAELNARFAESGVGYVYSDGELIRVDSQFRTARRITSLVLSA